VDGPARDGAERPTCCAASSAVAPTLGPRRPPAPPPGPGSRTAASA